MSLRATRACWPIPLPPMPKLVLVCLADKADEDGGSIFPSVTTVAAECGCSDQTVRNAIKILLSEGILELVEDRPGRSKCYRITGSVLALTPQGAVGVPLKEIEGSAFQPLKEIDPTPQGAVGGASTTLTPPLNHVDPNNQLTTKEQPVNFIAETVKVLVALPGIARGRLDGAEDSIASALLDLGIPPSRGPEIARAASDWCRNWKTMGENSTHAIAPGSLLRDYWAKNGHKHPEATRGEGVANQAPKPADFPGPDELAPAMRWSNGIWSLDIRAARQLDGYPLDSAKAWVNNQFQQMGVR